MQVKQSNFIDRNIKVVFVFVIFVVLFLFLLFLVLLLLLYEVVKVWLEEIVSKVRKVYNNQN